VTSAESTRSQWARVMHAQNWLVGSMVAGGMTMKRTLISITSDELFVFAILAALFLLMTGVARVLPP